MAFNKNRFEGPHAERNDAQTRNRRASKTRSGFVPPFSEESIAASLSGEFAPVPMEGIFFAVPGDDTSSPIASCRVNPNESFVVHHQHFFSREVDSNIVPAYSDPEAPIASFLARRAALARGDHDRMNGRPRPQPLGPFQGAFYELCSLVLFTGRVLSFPLKWLGLDILGGFRRADRAVWNSLAPW